jgi:hypothetical protein
MLAPAFGQVLPAANGVPHGRVSKLTINTGSITVLHLRAGFVSSVRLPEEISSVVLGDPKAFKAEHSEAEPRLVFLRPTSSKESETNVLITTKSGHEVSLHLVSSGNAGSSDIDFLVDYERPRSVLIPPGGSSFLVAESREITQGEVQLSSKDETSSANQPTSNANDSSLKWTGKAVQVAVGEIVASGPNLIVPFSVRNNSDSVLELMPPRVQLSGSAKQHGKVSKAELIPIASYSLPTLRLSPSARVDGVLTFERPTFKESSEQLQLQIVEADKVDRPILVPIAFTAVAERKDGK